MTEQKNGKNKINCIIHSQGKCCCFIRFISFAFCTSALFTRLHCKMYFISFQKKFEHHHPQSDGMCLLCQCSWFMLSAGSRISEQHWHLTYNHIWQMKTLESMCHLWIQLRQIFNLSIMRSLVWNSVNVCPVVWMDLCDFLSNQCLLTKIYFVVLSPKSILAPFPVDIWLVTGNQRCQLEFLLFLWCQLLSWLRFPLFRL